jgi:hypothetical protein
MFYPLNVLFLEIGWEVVQDLECLFFEIDWEEIVINK